MENDCTVIFLEGEFTTLNDYIDAERSHRHNAARIKKHETVRVQLEANGTLPINEYPVCIVFTWYRKNTRTDPDNVAFAKKFILDGLQKANVLAGDGCKHICGFEDKFFFGSTRVGVEVKIKGVSNGQ